MEPIVIYAIITGAAIVTGILIGALIGWLSAKSKFGSKIGSLQTQLGQETVQLAEQKANHEELLRQVETIQQELEETLETKKMAEWKLSEHTDRLQHLLQEKETAKTKGEELYTMVIQTKESHATIKAQHDELYRTNIQLNNEKSRTKDDLEKLRLLENETAKKLAKETTKYNELIKSADGLAANMEKLQQEYIQQLTANNELLAQNHSLRAKYAEAQKAIIQQREFVGEAQKGMKDSFTILSAQALQQNNQLFLDQANAFFLKATASETVPTIAPAKATRKKNTKEIAVETLAETDKSENELF